MATATSHDPRFMLHIALKGFEDAQQRVLSSTAPGASVENVFVQLSEALWWTISVDEGFKNLADTTSGYRADAKSYKKAKDSDQFGRVLGGLQYARNRCGHHRVIIALEGGLRLPVTLPATIGNFVRWRPSAELPPAPPNHQNEALRQVYETHLVGRPVSQALESAGKWFMRERNIAGV